MKSLYLLLLFPSVVSAQNVKTRGAWILANVKWEHAPTSVKPKLATASTLVLYFDKKNHFAAVGCVINRELGRYRVVSAGDGQVVSSGEWDGSLPGYVKYRVVSRTVERVGESLPGPWQKERLTSTAEGNHRFKGELYRRAQDLEPSVRQFLPK